MPVEAESTFQTFGPPHWVAMALTVAVSVALPVWARKARSETLTRGIALGIAVVLVVNELVYYAYGLAVSSIGDFLRFYLPIHVCGAAVFLTAWVLWRRSQFAYDVAYFWGLAGTFQAVLTPDLTKGFPAYRFFEFFINHGAIVVGVLYATWALRMRPSRGAWWRTFAITNLYMVFVAGADWLLGANYMFLRERPVGESPFFFLPWPWYILFMEPVGLGLIVLLVLPFTLTDALRGRSGKGLLPQPAES